MAEKVGITNFTNASVLAFAIANQAIESTKDGFQISDLKDFLDEGLQVVSSAASFKEIGAEVKDFSQDEQEQYKEIIKAEVAKTLAVAIENEEVEALAIRLANELLDVVLSVSKAVYTIIEIRNFKQD